MAYQMQSVVPDVLNLEKESEATKRLYGLDGRPTKTNACTVCNACARGD